MTDEEAITYAMLAGFSPWQWSSDKDVVRRGFEVWYVRDYGKSSMHSHTVEAWWAEQHHRSRGGEYFFRSRAEAARAVCEYYKLGEFKDVTS